jgi:flavin-dependent thymidylate synthase
MKVELVNYTQDAMNLLLRTKNTRLGSDDDPATWSDEKKKDHLSYMLDTIKSSWEFVDYTFEITGVSRNFTHQLVRTRTGHYAQESQRTVDVRESKTVEPIFNSKFNAALWSAQSLNCITAYGCFIDSGMPVQDARGILPTAMETSIFAKFDLRTLHEMGLTRLCTRTQGEYQDVFRAMREEVLKVHPWAEDFIQVHCVALGICAFPRYGKAECQHYDPRMDLTELKKDVKLKFWSKPIQVAVPIAKDGKTMR